MEDFIENIIIEGTKYIVQNKWDEWNSTVKKVSNSQADENFIKEYFKDLINILKDLKEKEISDVIANLKDSYGNLNTAYTKNIAEQVAKFSPIGPKFLIQFINTFTDISQSEDERLTKYINDINKINKYIKEGLTYEEAELMTNKILIPVSIDGNEANVIPYDSFYQGLTQDNKLIIVSELSKDVILSYIFLDQEKYVRYIFQDARRIMIPTLLITNNFNNISDFKKSDNLVNFNNSIVSQDNLLNVHKDSKRLYNNLNADVLDSVLNEINRLTALNNEKPIVVSEGLSIGSNNTGGFKI